MLHQCPCGGVVCNGWFDSEPPIFKRLRDHDFLSPMRAPRIADLAELHIPEDLGSDSGALGQGIGAKRRVHFGYGAKRRGEGMLELG